MPQFDATSFFPQIVFFAGVFLIFYVFLTKTILPKISQNLKLNKKVEEVFTTFSSSDLKDINLLSYIYEPFKLAGQLIYKESLSLTFLTRFGQVLFNSYSLTLGSIVSGIKKDKNKNLFELNAIYLSNLNKIV